MAITRKRKRPLKEWFVMPTPREMKKLKKQQQKLEEEKHFHILITQEEKEEKEEERNIEKEEKIEQMEDDRQQVQKEVEKWIKIEAVEEKPAEILASLTIPTSFKKKEGEEEEETKKISIVIILQPASFTICYPLIVEKLKQRKFNEEKVEPGFPRPERDIKPLIMLKEDVKAYPNAFFESLYEEQSIEFLEEIQQGWIPAMMDMDPDALWYDEGNLYCAIVDTRRSKTAATTPTITTLKPTLQGVKRGMSHFIHNEYGNLTKEDRMDVEGVFLNQIHQVRKTLCLDPTENVNTMANQSYYNESKTIFRRKAKRKIVLTIDGNPSIHSSMAKTSYGKAHPLKPYLTDGQWSKQQFEYKPSRDSMSTMPTDAFLQQLKVTLDRQHASPINFFHQYSKHMLTNVEDLVRQLECTNEDKTVYYYIFVLQPHHGTAKNRIVDCVWYMVTQRNVSYLNDRIESNGADSFCERLQELLRTDKYNVEKKIINRETYTKRIKQLKTIHQRYLMKGHHHQPSTTRRVTTTSLPAVIANNPAIRRHYHEIINDAKLSDHEKKQKLKLLQQKLATISQAGPTLAK